MNAVKKSSLHRDVDVSNYTPQFQEVYGLAKALDLTVGALCELAGLPKESCNNWRRAYNPTFAHAGRLDQIRAAAAAETQRRVDAEIDATRARLAELESQKAAAHE